MEESKIIIYQTEEGNTKIETRLENETVWRSEMDTKNGIVQIWETMKACIYKGCHTQGHLPGGLNVKRRAFDLNRKLLLNTNYTAYESWL